MDDADNEMNTTPGKRKKSKSKRTLYSCPFCDLTCDHLGKIKDHMNVHTGYTPHQCPDCDMKYSTFSALSNHRGAGTTFSCLIRIFKCYKFSRKGKKNCFSFIQFTLKEGNSHAKHVAIYLKPNVF